MPRDLLIILVWFVLFAIFAGSYSAYFAYLKSNAHKKWHLKIDPQFTPSVTVLVPVHNEESVIYRKLENIDQVTYPKDKLEIVLIDDESTDQTLEKAHNFARDHPDLSLRILIQAPRKGKAHALNKGLEYSSNDIIIVSDADAFWPTNILRDALPYLSDSTVGAITGQQVPENIGQTWVTRAEESYLDFMHVWRLGESKIHSTIRFEGVFCAFKKSALEEFDCESGADDSGTALRVVQRGFRSILVPEARVPSEVQPLFGERIKVKTRRATQLAGLWLQCLRLLVRRRLKLPKRLAVPEIFLSLFVPFIFVALVVVTILLLIIYPIVLVSFVVVSCIVFLIPKARRSLVQGVVDQFILFYSVILCATNKRFIIWEG